VDVRSYSSLINATSYMTGWLCKIKLSSPSEFEELLSAEAYKAHCDGSS
jgi:glycine cleavage system H protein